VSTLGAEGLTPIVLLTGPAAGGESTTVDAVAVAVAVAVGVAVAIGVGVGVGHFVSPVVRLFSVRQK